MIKDDDSEIVCFCRLPIPFSLMDGSVHEKVCFVVTFWKEESFRVYLTDSRLVWVASVPKKHIEEYMCPRDSSVSEYLALIKESLVFPTAGNKDKFVYSVKQKRDSIKFHWEIRVDEEDLFLNCNLKLSIQQDQLQKKTIQEIMTWLIERETSNMDEISNLRQENEQMRKQQAQYEEGMKKITQDKERMELELYEKFVVLLNAKKKEIRSLREKEAAQEKLIESMRTANSNSNSSVVVVKKQKSADGQEDEDEFKHPKRRTISIMDDSQSEKEKEKDKDKRKTQMKRIRKVAGAKDDGQVMSQNKAKKSKQYVTSTPQPRAASPAIASSGKTPSKKNNSNNNNDSPTPGALDLINELN